LIERHHWWAPGALGYDESIEGYKYNPAKVKELLTAAGHPNGISIELNSIAREPENTIAEFAQQMWTNVGIKTKVNSIERLAWIDAQRAKKFQAAFSRGQFNTVIDPALMINVRSDNLFRFADKEVDRLMEEGDFELDLKKRTESYRLALKRVQDQAYQGSAYAVPLVTAHRKQAEGIASDHFSLDLRKVWLK